MHLLERLVHGVNQQWRGCPHLGVDPRAPESGSWSWQKRLSFAAKIRREDQSSQGKTVVIQKSQS